MKKTLLLVLVLVVFQFNFSFALNDEDPSGWARSEIDKLFKSKSIDSRFRGHYKENITRKDFAYLGVKLYESITGNTATMGNAKFPDTEDEYVLKAKNLKIVSGNKEDGSYKPQKFISRSEICKLLSNVLRASGQEVENRGAKEFLDHIDIPIWAKDDVYAIRQRGILNGVGGNLFRPNQFTTREQALLLFSRVNKMYGKFTMKELVEAKMKGVPFELTTIDDKKVCFEDYKEKYLLLCFVNDWQSVSRHQMLELKKMDNKYKNLEVLVADMRKDNNIDNLKEFVKNNEIGYNIVVDLKRQLADRYRVGHTSPETLLISKEGLIIKRVVGLSLDELIGDISEMLEEIE